MAAVTTGPLARAAGVATAGFVLSRLLLEAPSQALATGFTDPAMRATWPLTDAASTTALELLGAADDPLIDVGRDHARLLRGRRAVADPHAAAWLADPAPAIQDRLAATYRDLGFTPAHLPEADADHAGYLLACLAEVAARAGRAAEGDDPGETARLVAESRRLRRDYLDPTAAGVIPLLTEHARTHVYRALPGLLAGFLTGHAALCATLVDEPADETADEPAHEATTDEGATHAR